VPCGSGTSSSGEAGGGAEVELAAEAEVHLAGGRLLGDRDGRQSQHDALQRGGHRARIGDVVAEVGAVVDPGDDRLGGEALDEAELGQAHAVHRRAVGGVAVRAVVEVHPLHPQRPARRDRARHRRAVAVGRDDRQIDVGDVQQRLAQRLQSVGPDPVVVGQQHAHDLSP
jgi:hypothetical protein